MIENGKTVQFEYILKVDGEVFDSTFEDNPMEYIHGRRKILPGLEKGLEGLKVGDEKHVIVDPEEGLGHEDKRAFVEVPIENLPNAEEPKVGDVFAVKGRDNRKFQARVSEINDETVILNCNHPLAGKTLYFKVKILEIHD